MVGRLANRTAIVTGSSGSLGQAIALALAAEGANICCVDLFETPRNQINPSTGKADDYHNRTTDAATTLSILQKQHGEERAIFQKADVTSPSDWKAAIAACVKEFGRLDILCNNAGISVESTHERPLPVHETSEEDWDRTMAINSKSVFFGCKYGIEQMLAQSMLPGAKDRGCIVNTSSVQGLVAYHNTPAYCASKGAVSQLTKQVALDYASEKIRCNAICPGFLQTTMTQNLQGDPEARKKIDQAHPLGGMGVVEDVARSVVFLASGDAGWITGHNLPVDGGYTVL